MAAVGDWNPPPTNTPGLAAQATCSRAALANYRHVCTGVIGSIACGGTAQTPIVLALRDSTTGAGNILFSVALSAIVNGAANFSVTFAAGIPGVIGNAMTWEFAGAGVAASQQTVTMFGYTTT
jgi:hypothetical protein